MKATSRPPSLAPRGLSRGVAASYIGVSASTFDWMVEQGLMPRPKRVKSRVIWDRHEIDEAFESLPDEEGVRPARPNPWDAVSNV
jgi:predicted DNA-binding transcriptional regulator AlpA